MAKKIEPWSGRLTRVPDFALNIEKHRDLNGKTTTHKDGRVITIVSIDETTGQLFTGTWENDAKKVETGMFNIDDVTINK